VTIDTETSERLLPEALDLLDKDNSTRRNYIEQLKWIPYPRANAILAELEHFLIMPRKPRMTSCLIVGDSDNGKSSLIQEFVKNHLPTSGQYSPAYPVILIEAPNNSDEGRLYNNILEKIQVPFKLKDSPAKKEHEVFYYLKLLETRMLILDDIHNILGGPVSKQKIFMSALKTINNKSISIVLLGIKDALNAVATDAQIISRFPPVTLPKWRLDRDYASLLASLERTLPLKKASNLASKELGPTILDLAEGLIGYIVDLVEKAAIRAIETNTERITAKEIEECGFIKPSEVRKKADNDL
jgi:Bacterial TniB protein